MGVGEGEEDTPLHEAVRYSDLEDTQGALEAGHDPNQIGLYQWSALHEAAHIGDEVILKLLLKHGGDPNKMDLLRGCTAVHYAASEGHIDCLQALLAAGGKWDTQDRDSNTCLDVATGDCIPALRKLRDEKLISENCSRETLQRIVISDTQPTSNNGSDIDTVKSSLKSGAETSSEVTIDPDEVSLASLDSFDSSHTPISSTSSWTRQAWKNDGPVLGVNRRLVLGQIQLSFEYNSKRSSFKIRIWHLTDLLLPPVDTSMISGIYIKSYLMPDKKKETKRKTEEVPVYSPEEKSSKKVNPTSRQEILKPSSFQFTKCPEYKHVTPRMVEERIVHIEVCISQKYTRRSFVLATWNMPMKEAVKKLVKERYPLTPRISTELPENMKVYDGSQLTVTSNKQRPYSSFPNTRVPSVSSLQRTQSSATDRAQSDTDLKSIKVEVGEVKKTSSIEITVQDPEEDELEHALQQITIMERAEQERWTSVPNRIPGVGDDESPRGSDSGSTRHTVVCDVHDVAVHIPPTTNTANQTYTNQAFDWHSSTDTVINQPETKSKRKRKFSLRNLKDRHTSSDVQKKEKMKTDSTKLTIREDFNLRSESPTWQWDNYMEPLQTAVDPVTFDDDFDFELDMPCLPMTTTLDMPRVHGNSFSHNSEEVETSFQSVVTNNLDTKPPDIVVIPPPISPLSSPKDGTAPLSSSKDSTALLSSPKCMSPLSSPKGSTAPLSSPKCMSPLSSPKDSTAPLGSSKDMPPLGSSNYATPLSSPKDTTPLRSPTLVYPLSSPRAPAPLSSPKNVTALSSPTNLVNSPTCASPVSSTKASPQVSSPKDPSPSSSPRCIAPLSSPTRDSNKSPISSPKDTALVSSSRDSAPVSSPRDSVAPISLRHREKVDSNPSTAVSIPEDVTFQVTDDRAPKLTLKKGKRRAKPGMASQAVIPVRNTEIEQSETGIETQRAIELSQFPTNCNASLLGYDGSDRLTHEELDDIETILI